MIDAGSLLGAEQRHDGRVDEVRGDADLAPEALDVDARGELGVEDFDDDPAPDGVVERAEHARHAASGELALDGVLRRQGAP
jgi:hypothetical protein